MEGLKIENNIKKEEFIEDKESISFDFDLHNSESGENYLSRLNHSIYELIKKKTENFKETNDTSVKIKRKLNLFDEFNQEEFIPYYKKAFEVLLKENPEENTLNTKKNTLFLEEVEFTVNARSYNDNIPGNKIENDFDSIKFFNKTNQERSFFPNEFKKDGFPYSYSLFEVANINSDEARQYLGKKLNNKTICLLGGGKSMQDLVESDFIHPELIVNVDPFLDEESINRNIHNNYKSIDVKADDPELSKKIEKEGVSAQFDEIWASYSVPFYNINPEEISNLFNNIHKMLAEGGSCRITPLDTQNQECVNMVYQKLEDLNRLGIYNFDLFDRTILIHKIKTRVIENMNNMISTKDKDEERIKYLKEELGI